MYLVTNGRLITRDPDGKGYYEHGAVAYEGSQIVEVGEESALRANILAITSFALNRVYTEFYRSRGYDFDITSSTAYRGILGMAG